MYRGNEGGLGGRQTFLEADAQPSQGWEAADLGGTRVMLFL